MWIFFLFRKQSNIRLQNIIKIVYKKEETKEKKFGIYYILIQDINLTTYMYFSFSILKMMIWFNRKSTQMKDIYLDFMKMYRSNFIKEN